MRFLMMHKVDERVPGVYQPTPELFAEMGKLMEEMGKAGVLLAGEGVLHSETGALITYPDGRRTVTDGPFTEAKEVIAGFAIIQARDKAEAIVWANRFADVIGDVTVEIRQIAEFSDIAPDGV